MHGKASPWSGEILAKWEAVMAGQDVVVLYANYFTPRPWCTEYDQGSSEEGFVYTRRMGTSAYVFEVVIGSRSVRNVEAV